MTLPINSTLPVETNAVSYRRAHVGKLMIVQRQEGKELVASDFFEFEGVGTHPTGLIVTGLFENARRSHMMASSVRAANEAEIAWRTSSTQNPNA